MNRNQEKKCSEEPVSFLDWWMHVLWKDY